MGAGLLALLVHFGKVPAAQVIPVCELVHRHSFNLAIL